MTNALTQNPFSQETRELFMWRYHCWKCNRTDRPQDFDHIMGRREKIHTSPLNLAPLCRVPCHQNKTSHDKPKLLKRTLTYLMKQDYQLTEQDIVLDNMGQKN